METTAPQLEVLPAHAPSHRQPSTPGHPLATTRAFKPKARNGKIARLPHVERDMVNRMLRNSIAYDKIREALSEHGIHVTERNISNWKTRGGYKEWCVEQDRALENRLLQDNLVEHLRKHDATELPEIGLQLAATNLSQFFLRPETQAQLAADPQKFASTVSMICRLSRHIHTLQKYRDETAKELGSRYNPERIKRHDEEHVEMTREIYSAGDISDETCDIVRQHHNYLPRHWDTPTEPLD
jgi:hypothetical protein